MGIQIGGQIGKVNGKKLGYNEFVEGYMEKNQPVVLTGLMDDWRACRDWVTDNGLPNLQIFATHFGKSKVQVIQLVSECMWLKAVDFDLTFQSHLVFGSCVYNISGDVSETNVPGFSKAIWLECIQEPNEIIFVPSGWYHQVHNLWDLLLREYYEAKEYIEDIKDICDLKVSANATLPLIQA